MHSSTLIAISLSNDNGNHPSACGRRLFGSNVEPRRNLGKIMVQIPANPNVTELESSGEAATHFFSVDSLAEAISDALSRYKSDP
jgi:hypothetical protein